MSAPDEGRRPAQDTSSRISSVSKFEAFVQNTRRRGTRDEVEEDCVLCIYYEFNPVAVSQESQVTPSSITLDTCHPAPGGARYMSSVTIEMTLHGHSPVSSCHVPRATRVTGGRGGKLSSPKYDLAAAVVSSGVVVSVETKTFTSFTAAFIFYFNFTLSTTTLIFYSNCHVR